MSERRGSCRGGGWFFGGPFWFAGWGFTIAFAHLHFWEAVLALIVWPVYLGSALAPK